MAVILLHPESINSARAEHHWARWPQALAWLLAETKHTYLLTGLSQDSCPDHARLVDLRGKTANAAEVFALADRCAAVISTCNSVGIWATLTHKPALVTANTLIRAGHDHFFGVLIDAHQTQLLRQNADLTTFQRACRTLEADLDGTIANAGLKTLLVQFAAGTHRPLLELTEAHHRTTCGQHGIDYRVEWAARPGKHPYWTKVDLLQEGLKAGYDLVVYLDADTLWAQPKVDLRSALRHGDLGCCQNDPRRYGFTQDAWHINAGAVWVRNTPVGRRLLRDWAATPDEEHFWHDQFSLNQMLTRTGYQGFELLRDTWNSGPANPTSDPVVRAWHGAGDVDQRLTLMRAALDS